MGFIFGHDGILSRIGSQIFFSGQNGMSDTITDASGMKFSSRGGSRIDIGDMSVLNKGGLSEVISKIGGTYHCGGKSYYKIGGMLCSSDGKSWSSVGGSISDDDIRTIIMHDQQF